MLPLVIAMLPRRDAIGRRQRPDATIAGTRCFFECDQRSIVHGAAIDPDVAVTHQRFDDVEPIGLAKYFHDFAAVAVVLDHIDEHPTSADQLDQRGARSGTIRLILFRRVDVLQTHVDVATFGRPYQETIAIENPTHGGGEIPVVRAGRRAAERDCEQSGEPVECQEAHRDCVA